MRYLSTSRKQVVFIHIPKTAGSTLQTIIARNYKPEDTDTIYTTKPKHKARWSIENSGKRMIYGHFHFVEELIDDSIFSFTLLRNPIRRVVSLYLHVKYSDLPLHKKLMEGVESFPDFLKNKPVYNLQTRCLCGMTFDQFTAEEDKGIEKALKNLNRISFIGITERFDDSLLCLSTDLSWNRLKFKNDNVQKRTDESIEILYNYSDLIAEKVKLDFKVYKKANELLDNRLERISLAQKQLFQLKKLV